MAGVHHQPVARPVMVELDADTPGLAQLGPGALQWVGCPLERQVNLLVARARSHCSSAHTVEFFHTQPFSDTVKLHSPI